MPCDMYRYTCPEAGLGLRNSQKKQQTLEAQLPRLRDSMIAKDCIDCAKLGRSNGITSPRILPL